MRYGRQMRHQTEAGMALAPVGLIANQEVFGPEIVMPQTYGDEIVFVLSGSHVASPTAVLSCAVQSNASGSFADVKLRNGSNHEPQFYRGPGVPTSLGGPQEDAVLASFNMSRLPASSWDRLRLRVRCIGGSAIAQAVWFVHDIDRRPGALDVADPFEVYEPALRNDGT